MLTFVAAFPIHAETHKARSDGLCAAHFHSFYGRAKCATERTLDIFMQGFYVFYKDHILHENFAGLVLDSNEGRAICAAFVDRKAGVLGNQVILTVGPTIEATVAWLFQVAEQEFGGMYPARSWRSSGMITLQRSNDPYESACRNVLASCFLTVMRALLEVKTKRCESRSPHVICPSLAIQEPYQSTGWYHLSGCHFEAV
jgi:hypothetical protein